MSGGEHAEVADFFPARAVGVFGKGAGEHLVANLVLAAAREGARHLGSQGGFQGEEVFDVGEGVLDLLGRKWPNHPVGGLVFLFLGRIFVFDAKATLNQGGEIAGKTQSNCDDTDVEDVLDLDVESFAGKGGIALAGEHDFFDGAFEECA